ncbi:uncharacterized protein LOC132742850 [Ruditapes philippinarum]|uniref:uncharacterized protein LOC132742850 n=1 Tax=Ruditapes philippinarum TaxID=129788 RepID=UPI00295C1319|nr:uncharacterized protein LOC132742850 [Ruditapes philippinarum]
MRSKSLTDCSGKCPNHPEENVTWYCRFHFQPGCHICKVEHPENCNSECVPDNNENANAEYVSNIIKEMDSFETKANDKITKAKKNLEDVESYYDSEVEKIRRMCKMLKDHIDSLENNALKEAKELFEEDKKTMETIIDNCEDAREEIQMVKKKTLKDSKKSSRNSSLRKSNPDIIKVKAVLSQNEKCNSVRHYHFEPDEGMFQYILGCNEIGIMHVADEGCVSVENADSDIPTDSTATTDDDIRPVGINGQEEEPESKFLGTIRVKSRSDRNPCYITGISVLSNEELVIADSQNNCIKMVDIERKKISSYLKMSFSPQDVTVVNNNLLAVTLPCAFLSMIQIVTRFGPFRWRTSHSLKANGNCYGITSTSDKLIVSFTAPPKVEVLSLQGEVLNTLDTSADGHQLFNQPRHLTVSEDKQYVYVSDRGSGSLTRLALSGDKDDIIQISQDTGWHISPEGIVTAEDSVLVCDMGSEEGNVYAFQEDLSEKGIVYDSKDGIRYPKTICYSPYQNKVFVTCHGEKVRNKIFLFKL